MSLKLDGIETPRHRAEVAAAPGDATRCGRRAPGRAAAACSPRGPRRRARIPNTFSPAARCRADAGVIVPPPRAGTSRGRTRPDAAWRVLAGPAATRPHPNTFSPAARRRADAGVIVPPPRAGTSRGRTRPGWWRVLGAGARCDASASPTRFRPPHAIEQARLRRQHRDDGVKAPKF